MQLVEMLYLDCYTIFYRSINRPSMFEKAEDKTSKPKQGFFLQIGDHFTLGKIVNANICPFTKKIP